MFKIKRFLLIVTTVIFHIAPMRLYAVHKMKPSMTLDDVKESVSDSSLSRQVFDAEQQVIESRYDEALKQYKDNQKQAAILQNQLDKLALDKGQYSIKKQQNQLIEHHQLQLEYCRIALLMKQYELAQNELAVMALHVSVEQAKLDQGSSTQLNVADCKSKKKKLENMLLNLLHKIEEGKCTLKQRLHANTVLDCLFVLPLTVEIENNYTVLELKKTCAERYIPLLQANAYRQLQDTLRCSLASSVGESDSAYRTAVAEKAKMDLNTRQLVQNMERSIDAQHQAFTHSLALYKTVQQRQNMLNKQLDVLKIKFDQGELSKVDYASDKLLVLKELYNIDTENVNLIGMKSRMELIENGIVLTEQ